MESVDPMKYRKEKTNFSMPLLNGCNGNHLCFSNCLEVSSNPGIPEKKKTNKQTEETEENRSIYIYCCDYWAE